MGGPTRSDSSGGPSPSVVTPGNHDGVHRGHRALVSRAQQRAQRADPQMRVVAMTFDPHPTHFVAPESAPPLLTSPGRRAELLRGAGADAVHIEPFDAAFAGLTPQQFFDDVLVGRLGARAVVVGSDFRFGARRAGDVALLRALGASHGVEVDVVEPVLLDGDPISSSRIRAALARGDVVESAEMLTRVHDVSRSVVQGAARGRTLGFPTANLELSGFMLPRDGVYVVAARALSEPASPLRYGVANLGVRPTMKAGRSVEVHLLDFAGDLYGRELRVGFMARLRGEQKFASLDALKAQIARDVSAAREVIAGFDVELLRWI